MKKAQLIIIAIGAWILASTPTWAQEEFEVDWVTYAQDTVVPTFTHSIDLGYDHTGYQYNVAIEYPELTPLTLKETQRYRLPTKAGLPEWPIIEVYKGISAKRGQLDISFIPIIWRDGQYQKIINFTLKVERTSPTANTYTRAISQQEKTDHSPLSTGRWVKIRVSDNGIHMLTHARLKGMGFSNPNKVRLYGYGGHPLSEDDTNSWREGLSEVPVWRGNNRILFYACGPVKWVMQSDNTFTHTRNPYSEYGYYFLTDKEEEGEPRSAMSPIAPSKEATGTSITTTPTYSLHEVDDYAWFHSGRQLVESHDFAGSNVKRYQLSTINLYSPEKATLDVCFTHNGNSATSLSVTLNDTPLGTLTLSPIGRYTEAASATRSYTTDLTPTNTSLVNVTLTHNRESGISGRLDFLRLNYTSCNSLGIPIYATSSGTHTYEVINANEHAVVWDITDSATPVCLPSTINGKTLIFTADDRRGNTYMAFDTQANYPTPEEVGEIANQDLHATEATDYIIIVPANGKLTAQAERLAEAHRARNNLSVKVVRADEIYNEFSSGTPDATAYRRYLKTLYDRATTKEEAPKYLLLFGDGAWDNRMLTSAWKTYTPDDYLLCFESVNSFSATSSFVMEDYFGLLDDGEGSNLLRDKVDVGVGRFPVTTVEDARNMVDKVISYMNNEQASAWKNTILMVGDDGDNNQHMSDAEQVANMIQKEHPDYMVKRIYWDNFPMEVTATGNGYPTVRKRLLELFNEGALMVNYSGHGSPDVLSHELVISKTDMEQLNSPRLPIWVTASCDITPFDNTAPSFGEKAFLNPKGGAIALFTTTRTVYSEQNRRINLFFSKYLLGKDQNGNRMRIGDAVRQAKCSLVTTSNSYMTDNSENKLHYVLIGDPALTIGSSGHQITIDKLNGKPAETSKDILLKAGSVATIEGHIEDWQKKLDGSYSGLLYVTVFDNLETIVCRNNLGTAKEPWTYQERTKTLYVGSDSVRQGKFTLSFRIPMDINYSSLSGLINMYAIDNTRTREAQGSFDSFLLGDTDETLNNDSTGPKMKIYLNSPDFTTGDKVNETPRLIMMLEDSDGINAIGNSIGHDIIATIDGQASMTYNLNSYYQSAFGDYTRGTISYIFPELPEGKHTLHLRAWDMMNNATNQHLEFEVVKGLSPRIIDIRCTHTPAREHTTFILTHDRPENEVQVCVEIFELSGRRVWMHQEQVVTPDNQYSIDWNLCNNSGQPLNTGVYLYRTTIASTSGESVSQTHKLVILR